MSCRTKTKHGPCQQETAGTCSYHLKFKDPGFHVDEFYHRKVVAGKVSLSDYLTESQVRLLFRGRAHKDGRAADQWVI